MPKSAGRTFLALSACALLLAVCNGPAPSPSTPPTFVLAWTGPGDSIRTLESAAGAAINWTNSTTHANATSNLGPAVAHDGGLTWLLAWAAGGGLSIKTGVGGVPVAGGGGVTWEAAPVHGVLIDAILGSPALAYGDGTWAVVYRSTGDVIRVARSVGSDPTAWGAPTDLTLSGSPQASIFDPAVAFGTGGFVVAVRTASTDPTAPNAIVTFRSADALTWTGPSVVGPSEEFDPGLTFCDGSFYAILSRIHAGPQLSTVRFNAHASIDGTAWSGSLGESGNWPRLGFSEGPGTACGNGDLVVVQRMAGGVSALQFWIGAITTPSSPSSVAFAPSPPTGTMIAGATSRHRSSVAFGS